MRWNVIVMIWAYACSTARAMQCPSESMSRLPFVLEYAIWRGWQQTVIYAPEFDEAVANPLMVRKRIQTFGSISYQCCQWVKIRLLKCLSVNGIAASFDTAESPRLRLHLGVIILMPSITVNSSRSINSLFDKLIKEETNTAAYDWLISVKSDEDFTFVNAILNKTAIRFDQNVVVGYSEMRRMNTLGLCDVNFVYSNSKGYVDKQTYEQYRCQRDRSCLKLVYERNYYRASIRFRDLARKSTYKRSGRALPLFQSGIIYYDDSKPFEMTNISGFSLQEEFSMWREINPGRKGGVHVIQYFKVRANSTLYAHYLGYWTRGYSMSGVDPPFPVDVRNFLGEELVVGRCNSSSDGTPSSDEEGPAAPALLDDILHFLSIKLNATPVTQYYPKLGFRTYEGSWTGLLGAIVGNTVDVALEPVTAHPARLHDMEFIFPIAETMYNIYIRQQETSTARDIFLTPFSVYLVVSVLAVALLAAAAIALISSLVPRKAKRSGAERSRKSRAERMEWSEALVWSTGILCQQGGPSTPRSPSASILLIVCLLFGVVTYNAYAAFITSVLSVRVASLNTISAVLQSPNFKIGYIRNSADQMYLMSTKDVQLNEFYIRGYSEAENLVTSAAEGLALAAKRDYAFFGNRRTARTTLRSLSQSRGRCAVRELPVPSTRAQLAFPLSRRSPYARPTLISLLQLHNTGAMARLESALVPAMPACVLPAGFASARAVDVKSALILIVSGIVAAAVLGLFLFGVALLAINQIS